jgi:hypothetical protein
MTETNKAVWTVKKGIYELMKPGDVYSSQQIVELSEDKFSRQQAASIVRNITIGLLFIVTPTFNNGEGNI